MLERDQRDNEGEEDGQSDCQRCAGVLNQPDEPVETGGRVVGRVATVLGISQASSPSSVKPYSRWRMALIGQRRRGGRSPTRRCPPGIGPIEGPIPPLKAPGELSAPRSRRRKPVTDAPRPLRRADEPLSKSSGLRRPGSTGPEAIAEGPTRAARDRLDQGDELEEGTSVPYVRRRAEAALRRPHILPRGSAPSVPARLRRPPAPFAPRARR
jgi:hypothetical protein